MLERLKLSTLLREILLTGVPVFITGVTRSGKTVLAKEIASYGFSDVTYLGNTPPIKEIVTAEMEEQFTQAISKNKSTDQLLVIDEYQRFKSTNLEITEDLLNQYSGSLILITQIYNNLPYLAMFPELYIVNLEGNYNDFEYTIQYFKKKVGSTSEEGFINYKIAVPVTIEHALSHQVK